MLMAAKNEGLHCARKNLILSQHTAYPAGCCGLLADSVSRISNQPINQPTNQLTNRPFSSTRKPYSMELEQK